MPADVGATPALPAARRALPPASGRSRRLPVPPLRTVLCPAPLLTAAAAAAVPTTGERRKEAMLRCLVVRRVLGAGLFRRSPAGRAGVV